MVETKTANRIGEILGFFIAVLIFCTLFYFIFLRKIAWFNYLYVAGIAIEISLVYAILRMLKWNI